MDDEEFKREMAEHMQLQTEFMGNISRVASIYEQNAKVVRSVFRFISWVVAIAASGFGIMDFFRGHK